MGSGESDAIKVEVVPETKERRHQPLSLGYTINNLAANGNATTTTSNITTGAYLGTGTVTYPWTYGYAQTQYIYVDRYQIKCPKCSAMNFLQLDTITPCKKCKSKLKATQQQYDFEVPVEL